MRIVKLPVKISILTEDEILKYEELGMKIPEDASEGEIYVNADHIAAFLPLEDSIDMELASGRRINIYMDVEEFKTLIQG